MITNYFRYCPNKGCYCNCQGTACEAALTFTQPPPPNYNYGWICPRCYKVHAPHVPSCTCVPNTVGGTSQ